MKQKLILSGVVILALSYMLNLNAQTTKTTTKTKTTTTKTNTVKPVSVKVSSINTTTSYIGWLAKKVVGQHNGKVKLQDGTVTTKNGVLTGGSFTVDMKSITCDDLTDIDYNKKLIGHLNSTDFFNVYEYPVATIKITKVLKLTKKVNTYNLTADLTIKGITKSITFPATFKTVGKIFEGVAKITIDRTLWDIKYGSSNFFEGLGDKAIKNDVELNVSFATN